ISAGFQFSHFARANQPQKEGGLGSNVKLPIIADQNMSISNNYGVLPEEEDIALHGLFTIDPKS
ncbi:hypothetical protein ARMGADRAFT_942134, partial [Armillaria gallica]